jgi:hypothetical protein
LASAAQNVSCGTASVRTPWYDHAMDKINRQPQQPDPWTWIVLGLVFGAVVVALYGPFVWELAHRATA